MEGLTLLERRYIMKYSIDELIRELEYLRRIMKYNKLPKKDSSNKEFYNMFEDICYRLDRLIR
jgi:hypothetical protein